jgi:hypothetical protein
MAIWRPLEKWDAWGPYSKDDNPYAPSLPFKPRTETGNLKRYWSSSAGVIFGMRTSRS